MNSSVEAAYEQLAGALIDSAQVDWDELTFQTQILGTDCSSMTTTLVKDGERQSIGLGFDNGFRVNDAALFLRDEILRTTGQRIWGLTFTLYPSGKFKLDYDYTKPDWYDDSEESLSPEAAVEDLRSAGVDVAVQTSSRDEQQAAFFHDAMTWLQERTAANARDWGLGLEAQWNLDMNTGQLCFSFSDGRTVLLPVQVVGTYNTQDGTLLWGWDHPSVPGPLRLAAERLRDYFKEHGWMRLNDRILRCTEDEAWQLTAAAARLSAAAGAYRGNAGGTWVYMTFGSSR